MKFLFQLVSLALLVHFSTQATCVYPPAQWCYSTSDPIIETFDPYRYNFKAITNYTLFYADTRNNDISITGSFLRCNLGCTMTCNCGFHFKAFNTILFIDSCGLSNITNTKITDVAKQFFAAYDNQIVQVDCTQKIVYASQETDANWWNTPGNAVNINNQILCARKFGSKTIIIRTNYRNKDYDVYARVVPAEKSGLAQVAIRAAPHSYSYTKGLCGKWNGNSSDDDAKFYLLSNGSYIFQNSLSDSAAFQSSALSAPPQVNIANCPYDNLVQCAYDITQFAADVISNTAAIERTEDELLSYCDSLIYDQDLIDLHTALDVDTAYLDFYYDFCKESVIERASDDTLESLRTAIRDKLVPVVCELDKSNVLCTHN